MQTEQQGTEVRVEDIRHRFRDFLALHGVTLHVEPGEFVTLLGPSGSGKTTLLRIISGLLQPTDGRVYIGGRDVTRLPAQKRNIGLVFQNYALFPHLNVFDNVAFPLKVRRINGKEVRRRVGEALDLVQLSGFEKRHPAQLSGGQQQRVALARAIVFRPAVLLMDEPLGSLDKRLRQQLQIELRRLQKEVGITTIYVTHDQEEAFSMSDRIAVMNTGSISQLGEPSEIYTRPADSFVAHFVGDLNYLRGAVATREGRVGTIKTGDGMEVRVDLSEIDPEATRIACGVRPERIKVGCSPGDFDNVFTGRLRVLSFRGSHSWGEVLLPSGDAVIAQVNDRGAPICEGDEVSVGWNMEDAHVFIVDDELDEEEAQMTG